MSSLKTDLTPPDQSGDSETRSMAAPAVAPAAERPAVLDPPDPSSAERLLTEMVRQARAAHDEATARFQEINEANPGGSPRPELTARLQEAAATQRSARAALAKALDQLNDFLLYGIIPETSAPAANRDRERELEAALFVLCHAVPLEIIARQLKLRPGIPLLGLLLQGRDIGGKQWRGRQGN